MTPRVVVIAGPTASGKTPLSLRLADVLRSAAHGPEVRILSADAMCVYREMDIGTAKPTIAERNGFAHFGIDLCDPSVEYSLADWLQHAREVVSQAKAENATLIIVGGTGLYVHALVDNLVLPGQFPAARAQIEAEPDTFALYLELKAIDPLAATKMEPTNRRRIVRALEVCKGSGQPFSSFGPGVAQFPETSWTLIGTQVDRELLDTRIAARIETQLGDGWLDEVARLRDRDQGWSKTARQALGYPELLGVVNGSAPLADAIANICARTRVFARRQQRWFRRDPRFEWMQLGQDGWSDETVSMLASKIT